MIHIINGNCYKCWHEYWEDDKYEKHLAEPLCGRWTPFYVCHTYTKQATDTELTSVDIATFCLIRKQYSSLLKHSKEEILDNQLLIEQFNDIVSSKLKLMDEIQHTLCKIDLDSYDEKTVTLFLQIFKDGINMLQDISNMFELIFHD